ncbi:MAG: cadmium-translocating P-type ATPase [Oscillospiraceae bacterium]|nr:cadmium-translocating P-type ATPase [Oscillospiraceae bacterium]MCI2035293.1 cadmium-translocating P-type ATPase [Oscillospiraceae bacterium]
MPERKKQDAPGNPCCSGCAAETAGRGGSLMSVERPERAALYLSGLDGADCAKKIEAAVSRVEGVRSAEIDFVSRKLTVEPADPAELTAVVRRAEQAVRKMEPDVRVQTKPFGKDAAPAEGRKSGARYIRLAVGIALFAAGMILPMPRLLKTAAFLASSLLTGWEVLWKMVRNLAGGRIFDENFLMSVAAAGAFAIGDFAEGAAVMLFYRVGEFLQDRAVDRSRRSISALLEIRPDYANRKTGDKVEKVSPEEVCVGDQILVRPGERVPLDGTVVEGRSFLDTSALTGESVPRSVGPGGEILSGSVNGGGPLTVAVTKKFGESAVSRILALVQNAGSRKAPTENFITRFARYYTPAVVFAALVLAVVPPLAVPGASFAAWINRALTFLVVSCPCALVISIPLSFFAGIGGASRRGILIKGGNYLEALSEVDTVAFDKTGTLTKGNFKVTRIEPEDGWARDELLDYAAYAELYSSHPVAVSIREAYGKQPDSSQVGGYEEIPGKGVRAEVRGTPVLAGNAGLMETEGIRWKPADAEGTIVYLAVGGAFAGSVAVADEIKPDSVRAIRGLKAVGVRKTVMLTGDGKASGDRTAKALGIDSVSAELLPQRKVEEMERLGGWADGKLVFVGDGINDAPVLARADVGVAMGGLGSDAAIEAADVVLMTDEPSKLVTAIRIAKKTRSIARQNIALALGVKAAILVLAVFGIATMWEAVFGDVGVAILAVLNAVRAAEIKDS